MLRNSPPDLITVGIGAAVTKGEKKKEADTYIFLVEWRVKEAEK